MKKLTSVILCLSMLFSLSVTSFAADITMNNSNGDTIVTYGMNESFLVTIPGDFTIGNTGKTIAEVSASNVMIGHGKTLEVSISGDDYVSSWELIDETESTNMLTYTIGNTDGGSDIVNNSVVLSVAAGTAHDTIVSETLYFTVVDEISKAGNYTDTLTFNVSIVEEDLNHEGIYFNRPYKGAYVDSENYLEVEITVDESGNAKAWIGMIENEYVAYMEMPITFNGNEVYDSEGYYLGAISNNGKTVSFKYNSEITIELNLSKAITSTAPVSGKYVNTLQNAYIILEEDGTINGYINDEFYKSGSINDCIVHPSGNYIAAIELEDGLWYSFTSTNIQPEYFFTVNIPQTLAAENRLDKYSLMYDTSDGIGDDGAEGFSNMAIIMIAAGLEMYKLTDEVPSTDFIESMNVKVQDFTCGKTLYNIVLEKGYSDLYDFPDKDTLNFESSDELPNLYSAEVAEPLGKNYLTTKTSNGIITYYFEEDCHQEENGVFFRLLVVPEAGYYSEGNIYYLEPGVYIHSYSPEFNPPHNFKITFSK